MYLIYRMWVVSCHPRCGWGIPFRANDINKTLKISRIPNPTETLALQTMDLKLRRSPFCNKISNHQNSNFVCLVRFWFAPWGVSQEIWTMLARPFFSPFFCLSAKCYGFTRWSRWSPTASQTLLKLNDVFRIHMTLLKNDEFSWCISVWVCHQRMLIIWNQTIKFWFLCIVHIAAERSA